MSVAETEAVARSRPAAPAQLGRMLGVLVQGDPVLALGIVWMVLLLVQNGSPNIIGIDGYYHIKFAWLMRQEGLKLDFPWLPLTILNPQAFTDHHLLYHILLIPFTFGDLRLGGKAAGLVYSVIAVFSVYLVMTRLRIRYPLFWLVVLLGCAEWFLARESMTRRQSVSLAMLVLATHFLINGRFRWLLPLAFAYAWLFDGFVLLIAVVGLGFGARLLAEGRWRWPILGWTAVGLGLALLLNPYFPNNITFTYLHILPKAIPESQVTVGNEWYPYPLSILWRTSWLAVVLVPLGFVPVPFAPRRMSRDSAALLLAGLALLFLVLYLRSRRFIETEPAFALLFCAYAWSHYFPARRGRSLWELVPRPARLGLVAVGLIGLGAQSWDTVRRAQRDAEDNHIYTTYQAATAWIQQNSTPGERVYHTDWDDFPELFFYDTYNTYIVGLDPTYMFLQNPELYMLWRGIGRGQVEQPSKPIREQFNARWVITDRAHSAFMNQAANDSDMELVFQAPNAVVYRVAP